MAGLLFVLDVCLALLGFCAGPSQAALGVDTASCPPGIVLEVSAGEVGLFRCSVAGVDLRWIVNGQAFNYQSSNPAGEIRTNVLQPNTVASLLTRDLEDGSITRGNRTSVVLYGREPGVDSINVMCTGSTIGSCNITVSFNGMSTTTDPITTEVSTSSLTTNRIGVLIQQNEELEDEVGDLKTNVIGLSVGVPLTLVITVVLFSVFFIIIRFSREARNSIFPE